MFQSCLICTDFTDGLSRLVDFVPNLAQGGLQQIVFVHSVPLWEEGDVPRLDQDKIATTTQYLSRALAQIPEGVEVKIEIPSGRPLDTITKILEKYQSEVIFLGTPIRNSLQEKIFGSTSMTLVTSTAQPLMILRPQLTSAYTQEELALRCQHLWRYLLIPYNDSPAAHYLIAELKKYASKRPENSWQRCLLCWFVDDGGRTEVITEHRLQEAEKKLAEVKVELEQLGLEVETTVRLGNPLNQLLNLALNFDISAIAIAADYRNNLLESLVPSFANDVLHRSWFPVLFFSPKK